jgi:hypothetical protein
MQEVLHGGAHKLAVQVQLPLHCCMAGMFFVVAATARVC